MTLPPPPADVVVRATMDHLVISIPAAENPSRKVWRGALGCGLMSSIGLAAGLLAMLGGADVFMALSDLLPEAFGAASVLLYVALIPTLVAVGVLGSGRALSRRYERLDQHRAVFRIGLHTLTLPAPKLDTVTIDLAEVAAFHGGPPPAIERKDGLVVPFAVDRESTAQAWLVSVCQAALARRGDAGAGAENIPSVLASMIQRSSERR